MNVRSTIAIACALFPLSALAAPAEDVKAAGKPYVSALGGYDIVFPKPPKEEKVTQETPAGPIDLYSASFESDSAAYAVTIANLPAAQAKTAIPATVLDGARDGAVANVGGKLLKEMVLLVEGPAAAGAKTGKKQKWPGREIFIQVPGGAQLATRIYLVGARLYQIMLVKPNGDAAADFKPFAESFHLR